MSRIEVVTVTQIPDEWITDRRTIVERDGFALRAARAQRGYAIEIKSLVTNQWMHLALPGNATEFAEESVRDAVLKRLTGG
jgi:hypothetical protein